MFVWHSKGCGSCAKSIRGTAALSKGVGGREVLGWLRGCLQENNLRHLKVKGERGQKVRLPRMGGHSINRAPFCSLAPLYPPSPHQVPCPVHAAASHPTPRHPLASAPNAPAHTHQSAPPRSLAAAPHRPPVTHARRPLPPPAPPPHGPHRLRVLQWAPSERRSFTMGRWRPPTARWERRERQACQVGAQPTSITWHHGQ